MYAADSPILQTPLDAGCLRKMVLFCYTDEVCFEDETETMTLLRFAIENGITDLTEKCERHLGVEKKATAVSSIPSASSMQQNLIIFGAMSAEESFSGAMLQSLNGKWIDLPGTDESQKFARPLASFAHHDNDIVIVSGGLRDLESKTVRLQCNHVFRFVAFTSIFIHSSSIWLIYKQGKSAHCHR